MQSTWVCGASLALLLSSAGALDKAGKVDKVKEVFDRFDMNEDQFIDRRELSVLVRVTNTVGLHGTRRAHRKQIGLPVCPAVT